MVSFFKHTRKYADPSESSGPRKFSGRVGKWTVLCVADNGKVISVGYIKQLGILLVSILLAATTATIWLFILNRTASEDKRRLKEKMSGLQRQVIVLQDERDVLLAQWVMSGTKSGRGRDGFQGRQSEKDGGPPPAVEGSGSTQIGVNRPRKALQNQPGQAVPLKGVEDGRGAKTVRTENFSVFHEPDTDTLKVRFVIRKTDAAIDADIGRISGHLIVVLKPDGSGTTGWLTIPTVPLVSGKPSGEAKGLPFSFSSYKKIRLKANGIATPDRFKRATVHVFSSTGELILEKHFSVKLERNMGPGSER